MRLAQTYYWRVDTVLEDGTRVAGPVWHFTTEFIETPGVVITHSTIPNCRYLGSPAIARLPDGTYIASHDFFGSCTPPGTQTAVFESRDGGRNWVQISLVEKQFWSSLFYHEGALYLMGTNGSGKQYCVIRRSDDGGHTWTTPTDSSNGLLFADRRYHTAPVPVTIHGGRIWRAMEDRADPGKWPEYYRAFMMSAPVGADLLNAASWTSTNRLSYHEDQWPGAGWLDR